MDKRHDEKEELKKKSFTIRGINVQTDTGD